MMGVIGNTLLTAFGPTKHRYRTGPHHLGDAQRQGRFEDVDEALAIHPQSAERVGLTTNTEGSGEVDHAFGLILMHGTQYQWHIGDVPAHHAHLVAWRSTEDVSQKLTIRHYIKDRDLVPGFEQGARGIRTDKARTTGDEIAHGCPSPLPTLRAHVLQVS